MNLIEKLKKELIKAKKSNISSWVDEVSDKLDKANRFFELADKLGLVVNGKYVSGIPNGSELEVNEFYLLEDILNYPNPQKI